MKGLIGLYNPFWIRANVFKDDGVILGMYLAVFIQLVMAFFILTTDFPEFGPFVISDWVRVFGWVLLANTLIWLFNIVAAGICRTPLRSMLKGEDIGDVDALLRRIEGLLLQDQAFAYSGERDRSFRGT